MRNLAAATALSGRAALMIGLGEDQEAFLGQERRMDGAFPREDREIPGLFHLRVQRPGQREKEDGSESVAHLLPRIQAGLPPDTLIFWDTPSALSPDTRTALFLAHGVFIPLMVEAQAFDRLGPTLGFIEWARRERKTPLPLLGLIPVRVHRDQRLSGIFSGPALALFRSRMAPVPVPEDLSVQRAEKKGISVFHEDVLSPAALAFRMLSLWIQERCAGGDGQED